MSRESKGSRIFTLSVSATLLAILFIPLLASPARACSCAVPSDVEAWVDESEAAFVGTLVDKRSVGSDPFAGESIYVFEVEHWVKGDLGEVIEVRSASDGAGCGFEFWSADERIGAVLDVQNDEIHGGLCSQIDPDVLLAAMEGPTRSTTGVAHLLTGWGFSSSRLTVVDQVGGHVMDISPPGEAAEWEGTQGLEECPGRDYMIQWTQSRIVVWDLANLTPVEIHEVTGEDGYPVILDASCKSLDASSIWVAGAQEFEAELFEVVGGNVSLMALSGQHFTIGTDFVVSQLGHEADATWIDVEDGTRTLLTETPDDQVKSISVATHPTQRLVAIVETDFNEGGPVEATLSIVEETSRRAQTYDIPWETYSPTWLDEHRVAVKAYDYEDWERSFGFVFDLTKGGMTEIEGWDAVHTIADGDHLYGVNGGGILRADLSTREVETLLTLPTHSAGPLVLLDETPEVAPTSTSAPTTVGGPDSTTPPLVAPELGNETSNPFTGYQWIAAGAIVVFLGLLIWLSRRRPEA